MLRREQLKSTPSRLVRTLKNLLAYRTTSFSVTSYYLANRIFVERTKRARGRIIREIVVLSKISDCF